MAILTPKQHQVLVRMMYGATYSARSLKAPMATMNALCTKGFVEAKPTSLAGLRTPAVSIKFTKVRDI